MSGYFDCVCCGTVDMGEPDFCDVCRKCECTADECNCRQCVVDGVHGIHAAKVFVERFEGLLLSAGVPQLDIDLVKSEGEGADDAWSDIEGRYELVIDKVRYIIEQDSDIFLRRVSA